MTLRRPTNILTLLLFLSVFTGASAQRVLRDLESNTDFSSTAFGDSTSNNEKKHNVPIDVKAWTINPTYGDRTPIDVDTLQHEFQNHIYSEGVHGEYATLGNLGSPRESRIFMERKHHLFPYLSSMSQAIEDPDQYKYYNTKSPYMNLTYDWCGSKTTGWDNFKAIYTNNVGKRFNFGAIFHYMYGQGYYDNQSTSYINPSAWFSYIGDRYDLHLYYKHNDMKLAENGGITDTQYITNPEAMARSYKHDDIPTNLSATWSRQHHDIVTLNHRYHIGFKRTEEIDSVTSKTVFVPVTSVFHDFSLNSMRRRFISRDASSNFYNNSYLPGDTASNSHEMVQMDTKVGLTLHEGFNKYAVAGLSAFVGYRHTKYTLPDTIAGAATTTPTIANHKENDVLIGGRIFRQQGTYIHYNADIEAVVAGENAGDILANGHGELNLPLLGDTAQLAVDGMFSRLKHDYLLEHFHTKPVWWDKNLDAETKTRIFATLSYPKTDTRLSFGVENVSNYVYFKNTGTAISGNEGYFYHNPEIAQESSVQVLMARLRQNFKYKILNLDTDVVWQASGNSDILPLPSLMVYANFYLKFVIAKVLRTEIGCDMKFFTKYYAPDYDPATSHFTLQNENTREKIGGYPLFSAYINFALKKLRFHFSYYHFNQSDGRYFSLPHYPMNPIGIRMGISWNFYD